MMLARWLGVVFTGVQFALYTAPAATPMPFSRLVGVAVVLPLIAVNVLELLAGARLRRRLPRAWGMCQLCVDALVVITVVWLFAFDPSSALWALLALPVLEGALRAQLRGALLTWTLLSVGYIVRELWAAAMYPQVIFYVDSVTYRLGILLIIAAATGSLAKRLALRLEQVEGLQVVTRATRWMTSLDADAVLTEAASAAGALGFTSVRVYAVGTELPRWAAVAAINATDDPDQTHQWCLQLVARLATSGGPLLLRGADAAPVGGGVSHGQVLAVAVRTGPEVSAVLLAAHAGAVPAHRVQALEVLASHAGAGLANVNRYGERSRYERRLTHQATHDALTGLPNRVLLQDRMARALADVAGSEVACPVAAVLLLDLDRFKEVNDTFGHAYGDGLLCQIADRLSASLRGTDTAARLGGDEFAILATGLTETDDLTALAHRMLAALDEPFRVDGVVLDVEASIGIALAPTDASTVEDLLRCADVAMYTAKTGTSSVAFYDQAQDQHTPARLALLGDLRRALDASDQLHLHYQPKVDLVTGKLVGVEALLRWSRPGVGSVPPVEFIPVAEGTGLIHKLTTYVLDLALAQARSWRDAGHEIPVAVNLSTRCLLDQGLPGQVARLLARYGLPADLLRLEITESAIMADPTRAIGVLQSLAKEGVRLSIDDFGTGYSSMTYLKRLPVDELKVDRSFVTDMRTTQGDVQLVRSVIDLGHTLGLQVVAEGVEDADTLTALRELGCDIAQGYHLGRPMPAALFWTWLDSFQPGSAASPAEVLRAR
jgi:diguanylate cyclase (GGDEF)-like protein